MKQIITGLLFASSLSMAQNPPASAIGAATSTAAPQTTAGSAPTTIPGLGVSSTAAPQTTAAQTTTTSGPATLPAVTVLPGATAPPLTTAAATTAAPVTTAAATTSAPVAPATTASAPVTTAAATTAAPVTTAPIPVAPATTAAPVATPPPVNPYCPAGVALNQMGSRNNPQLPPGFTMSQNAECRSNIPGHPESRAVDFEGMLTCSNYACCLCQEISCGASGWPCEHLKIGDSGAVGVQNIKAVGMPSNTFWSGTNWLNGAQVDCSGLESCKMAKIRGTAIGKMECSGDYGCQGADIQYEATERSDFQCNGLLSCAGSKIEIVIPATVMEVGTIEFNGQQAAQGASLTIRALGASTMVQNLECMNPTACINLKINVIGNVWFENCDLQGMQNLGSMPQIIQQCALAQHGNFQGAFLPGMFPQAPLYPQYPQFPAAPAPAPQGNAVPQAPLTPPAAPAQPVTPVAPAQPVTPVTNPAAPAQPATPTTPAAPAQPANLAPMPFLTSNTLKCLGPQCFGRRMNLQVSNNFVFECLGNCQNMDLTLNVGYDPLNMGQPVERIDSLKFITPNSGNGATIRINTQSAGFYGYGLIEVNDIRCEGLGSCQNMKVYVDQGVDLWNLNFDCNTMMECSNCKVYQGTAAPIDCWTLQGNSNFGGGFFLPQTPAGYGYPAPQTPQYTAPQVPQYAVPQYPAGYFPYHLI